MHDVRYGVFNSQDLIIILLILMTSAAIWHDILIIIIAHIILILTLVLLGLLYIWPQALLISQQWEYRLHLFVGSLYIWN